MSNTSSRHIFDILRLISRAEEPLSVTEISRRLGIPTTTTHRGLVTLEQTGYIARYQLSARYIIGSVSKRLLQAFFARFRIRDVAIPYLRQLAATSGETVSLFVPVGWFCVRIASVKGSNEIIHTGPLGEVRCVRDSASSKVFLAYLPETERRRALDKLCANWPRAERTRLNLELSEIERAGYAVSRISFKPGWAGVALPVRVHDGQALAVIAIEGPALELTKGSAPSESWLSMIAEITALVRAKPDHFRNQYYHIDPEEVELVTTPSDVVAHGSVVWKIQKTRQNRSRISRA